MLQTAGLGHCWQAAVTPPRLAADAATCSWPKHHRSHFLLTVRKFTLPFLANQVRSEYAGRERAI